MMRVLVPALFAASLLACGYTEKYLSHIATGRLFYKYKKWIDATHQFMDAVEEAPGSYDAKIWLGNSAMEYGNDLFLRAHEMAEMNQLAQADQLALGEANRMHELARRMFQHAKSRKPGSMDGSYGIGRLHYYRVSSPLRYPYGENPREEIARIRAKELDHGIQEFRNVLGIVPTSYQSHRYLGMLLFVRLNPEEKDPEEGRKHLIQFYESRRYWYNRTLDHSPTSADDKTRIYELLDELRKEMDEVRWTLQEYRDSVEEEELDLSGKSVLQDKDRKHLRWLAQEKAATEKSLKGLEERPDGIPPQNP